jgi:hypothetical protein
MKSGGGYSHMHDASSRQKALGQTLVGKVFSAVEPRAGTDMDFIDHFSAAWTPSDEDEQALRDDGRWIRYVVERKRNENDAYALFQGAVAVFKAAGSGAAIIREPLRRTYCASFRDGFGYDPASKAGRKGPSGTPVKPDVYIRQIVSADAAEPPKYWSTVISFGEMKEKEELAGYTTTFNNLLLKSTLVLQDQYGYRRGHVVAFLLAGTEMRLFVFDRAGACVSRPFDIAEQPRRFMRCVAGLLVRSCSTTRGSDTAPPTTPSRSLSLLMRQNSSSTASPSSCRSSTTLSAAPRRAGAPSGPTQASGPPTGTRAKSGH